MPQPVIIGLFQKWQYEKTKNIASKVSKNEKPFFQQKAQKTAI
jgi:hypothetical protein